MSITKKQALLSSIQYHVSDADLEYALITAGLNGDDQFSKEDLEDVEKASIPVLISLWGTLSEREGGFTLTKSEQGMKGRLLYLARKYGRTDILSSFSSVPTISSVGRKGRPRW